MLMNTGFGSFPLRGKARPEFGGSWDEGPRELMNKPADAIPAFTGMDSKGMREFYKQRTLNRLQTMMNGG
jgi:hypothetical protein